MIELNHDYRAVNPVIEHGVFIGGTDPGEKGNTAQGGTKPATLETGLAIQVPLFVQIGDLIRVDTREKKYVERVK